MALPEGRYSLSRPDETVFSRIVDLSFLFAPSGPRRIMEFVNDLAVAGLSKVIEMLKDGDGEPIWNISDVIDEILRKNKVA